MGLASRMADIFSNIESVDSMGIVNTAETVSLPETAPDVSRATLASSLWCMKTEWNDASMSRSSPIPPMYDMPISLAMSCVPLMPPHSGSLFTLTMTHESPSWTPSTHRSSLVTTTATILPSASSASSRSGGTLISCPLVLCSVIAAVTLSDMPGAMITWAVSW